LAAPFFEIGRFLLAAAFFLEVFFAAGGFFFAATFLLDFFFAAGFCFAAAFFPERFFDEAEPFFTVFFFEEPRFADGREAFLATRFLLDGLFAAVFLRLGRFLAAAFFVGMEIASNGGVQKTRDYTEVQAERNTLRG